MPLLSWLLNACYLLTVAAAAPILAYRMVVHGKYRRGWAEKFLGCLPARAADPHRRCVWLHAVSVGEVLQLRGVLSDLTSRRDDLDIVVTTTTSTGHEVARAQLAEKFNCRVHYFPLDFSWAVKRALQRIRPDAVVLVELELWPNFIAHVARAGIPLALINGRISEKSYRGYRRIRPLMKRLFRCFDVMAVQNIAYAERLRRLGAAAARLHVTGSIKFDQVETNRDNPHTRELREVFGLQPGQPVFIAGSTQHPEETIALETWAQLREDHPDLRLILVPRHQERFEDVARLIERRGWSLIRRSDSRAPLTAGPQTGDSTDTTEQGVTPGAETPPVLLLDTLGELGACWGLADIAFVGGSLTRRGGQNMIEPAAYGAAVLFGPNTRNFRDVVEHLLEGGAARVVQDQAELLTMVKKLLNEPERARRLGETAQQLVLGQQGATRWTVDAIEGLLRSPMKRHSRAA